MHKLVGGEFATSSALSRDHKKMKFTEKQMSRDNFRCCCCLVILSSEKSEASLRNMYKDNLEKRNWVDGRWLHTLFFKKKIHSKVSILRLNEIGGRVSSLSIV